MSLELCRPLIWHAIVPSCALRWRAGAISGDEEAHYIKFGPSRIWRERVRIFDSHLPMACDQTSCLQIVTTSGPMRCKHACKSSVFE